jgi:hypothetical protein
MHFKERTRTAGPRYGGPRTQVLAAIARAVGEDLDPERTNPDPGSSV